MSAPEALRAVLARAFHRARAADANAEIARMRQEQGGEGAEHVSYEILVPEREPVRYLVETALPRLVYFLDCRGSKLSGAHGVFATLFVGDELYFVRARDLVDELSRLSGLSTDEMVRRWGSQSV